MTGITSKGRDGMGWVRIFHLFVAGYTRIFERFRGTIQSTLFYKEDSDDES